MGLKRSQKTDSFERCHKKNPGIGTSETEVTTLMNSKVVDELRVNNHSTSNRTLSRHLTEVKLSNF